MPDAKLLETEKVEPMERLPTRRRRQQHRPEFPRSVSEPASTFGPVVADALTHETSGRGTGHSRHPHSQFSASLPASFAQNRETSAITSGDATTDDTFIANEEASETWGHSHQKHSLCDVPCTCKSRHHKHTSYGRVLLFATSLLVVVVVFMGVTRNVEFAKPRTRPSTGRSTANDDLIKRRRSLYNISKPLDLHADGGTNARILEEDRRSDHHFRRKRIFFNAAEKKKMLEAMEKVKAVLERQRMQQRKEEEQEDENSSF